MCQVSDFKGLEEGCILDFKYLKTDVGQRKLEKRAVVRHVHGFNVGCEFVDL